MRTLEVVLYLAVKMDIGPVTKMNKRILLLILSAVVLLPIRATAASTWYISPSGSNANACTGSAPSQACLSLQYVFTNKFACGDTIIARGGIYYMPLTEGGVTITGKTCSSGSAESTLVAFNYGWGAQLVPALDSNGAITKVAVINGNSACLNGFCGSYAGTVDVDAVCPGLAAAQTTALNPTSVVCGSGFVATATISAGVVTAITVSSTGTGYPPNVKVYAQTGELPIFTDLLQVCTSLGTLCGGSGIACATGNPGVANGCLIVTQTADNNDPNFPGCTTAALCNGWLASLPSALQFFDTPFYQDTAAVGPLVRRGTPVQRLKNAIPKLGDTTVCKAAANQGAANVAFGCPSGGIPQPGGNFNCAAQTAPCPPSGSPSNTWFGGYIEFEYTTGDLDNPHSLEIGDERVSCQEIWTYCQLRLKSQTPGTPNIAVATGPAMALDNNGFIPGHGYYLRNRPNDIRAGDSYLDRCPNQWGGGSSSCNSGTPESTWQLFTAADQSGCPGNPCENPPTAAYWIPQMAPPLFNITTMNNFQIIGWALQGGNYPVPATGIASSQGQPNVPEMFIFGAHGSTTLMQNITLAGVIMQHTGGEGIGFYGNVRNLTIQDSAFVDGWGALLRVGDNASTSDVCSGGSQNVPSNLILTNNLFNGMQREDPTGESLGVYIGDVAGWTVDHNDMFRSMIGVLNIGKGLNLGAQGGQLAFCMANWVVSNNHIEGQVVNGGTLAIGADNGLVYGAWNHAPSSPAASLFADPAQNPANYTGDFFGNFIMHGGCDPAMGQTYHCTAGFYGDQGSWGVNFHDNIVGYTSGEGIFPHVSSHGQGTFSAAQFVPQHYWIHNNIFWGCGSNQNSSGATYRRGTDALGWAVIDQNIEVCDTSGNSTGGNNYRQNLFNGKWSTYDQSEATITGRGTPTCAGAISCASPASATVAGCTGATVSVAVDSIAGAFSGLIGVSIDNPGTSCSNPTLNFTNCPGCAATLCTNAGSLVACSPAAIDPTWAFKFGGSGNIVYDARGNFPLSGACKIATCETGSNLYATFPWLTTEDIGSINCDPKFVDPTYPALDFHPTNIPCLLKVGFVVKDYTLAGRTFPIIKSNTPPNLYPAIGTQIISDSSYNPSYVVAPVTSRNAAGGSGVTTWK